MGTTSSTGSLYFTGLSTFSSDFQSIIQRAVSIAKLPITNLQNEQTANTSKKQALVALDPAVAALGADVAALGTLANNQGLAASSSDSTTVSVVNTGATAPATYTVSNITSLASAASETSLQGYTPTQAVSASGHVNLVAGSNTYQIDLTGTGQNNLNGLAQAINNLNAGVGATILTAGSSNYLTLSASRTGATTLILNNVTPVDLVTNTGLGTETSLQTYADATSASVSATGQVQLVVGSQIQALNVSGSNNLNGLALAINNAHAGVTASVTGSPGAYSLSLAAAGPTTIKLNDLQSPSNLISSTNQGANADFFLNSIHVNRSSNLVNDIVPGLTFTLQKKTTGSVTLSLATDPSQLSSALQTFVTDYNALVAQVGLQRGPLAGPLGGDLIVQQISSDMQHLVTYWNPSSTSSIRSLSDLGLTFDTTGHLSFNSNTFNGLSNTQISDAFKFLGSASTGFAALASNFSQLSDPFSGLIQTQESGYDSANTQLGNQITTLQLRAAQVQKSATAHAQAADALVARLQSQQNTVNASIQSVNYALFGRQTGVNGI
jgi:flagellar hook-associated protein 2